MCSIIICLKVTFILQIIQVSETKLIVPEPHFPNRLKEAQRNDFKSIDANRIDIVLKLNSNKKTVPNKAVDLNSLNNLIPQNNCLETTSVCEEITTVPTTNCDKSTEAFTCTKEGTFGDPSNCDEFFICHRKDRRSDATLEKIKLTCPKGTAFDKDVNKCTRRARISCQSTEDDVF